MGQLVQLLVHFRQSEEGGVRFQIARADFKLRNIREAVQRQAANAVLDFEDVLGSDAVPVDLQGVLALRRWVLANHRLFSFQGGIMRVVSVLEARKNELGGFEVIVFFALEYFCRDSLLQLLHLRIEVVPDRLDPGGAELRAQRSEVSFEELVHVDANELQFGRVDL